MIVGCDKLLALFIGEARAHLKAYASVCDELQSAQLSSALTFLGYDPTNALELCIEKGFALLQVHRRAILWALRKIRSKDALEHLAFVALGDVVIVTTIKFNASLADFPFDHRHHFDLFAMVIDDLLKQEHSSQGVELRLYEIKGE